MQRKLKILYISSEIAPFVKIGNLADVARALPKVLREIGHDIRLFIPKYGIINERKYTLREVIRLKEIQVPQGDKTIIASVKSAFLPDTKLQVYFVENKDFFDRADIYFNPITNQEWEDNGERFIFFCRSIFEILKVLHWQPDMIHCNDWQTALIPLFLKTTYKDDPFFNKTHTLLSIHQLASQGRFDKKLLPQIVSPELFPLMENNIVTNGRLNFLKAGIVYADVVTIISKYYAKEVLTSDRLACGLRSVLRKRSKQLYGIVNGIDYSLWDPETDTLIPYHYSRKDLTGKLKNKQNLVESLNLKFRENTPVIGVMLLFEEQNGLDLLIKIIDHLMKMDIQLILSGTMEEQYSRSLIGLVKKFPDKLAINLKDDIQSSHQIEAGCDISLITSRFELYHYHQLYSLKYGTIPIVHSSGGFIDTIKRFDPATKKGYGFMFKDYSPESVLDTLQQAVSIFRDQEVWRKLVERAMKLNFSWQVAGQKYNKIYLKLTK